MRFKGKRVLITGSSGGLGKKLIEGFAAEGADIIAHARKQTKEFTDYLDAISYKYPIDIYPLYFDLQNEKEIGDGLHKLMANNININILINNAGITGENRSFQMTRISDMKSVFEVNFFATMYITQVISRKMLKEKKGNIINIASVAGMEGEPGQLEYSSSKAALICATKKLAMDLGAYHIRVNAIAPGLVDTDMLHILQEDMERRILGRTVIKRRAKASEITEVALFLASEEASYVTGQIWRVDGGMLS